ncbi:hypothetical protein M501DRAFT_1000176 [Patellaria atrata CBS 101060]|uniref:NUDE domain-containing protein n=1 Tax=Patellaria atrata CBS 101060 TaxID=1346257 RepID=A0A9P4S1I6_9PEZI|nr:hypothetical protein M501DRAFT_1000176 [Patellaria atrata CBS 101060]
MPTIEEPASSPGDGVSSLEEDLAYYKSQYEQLELELQEFQASSRELEAELEKDIEASEKRERQLQEKVENIGFEVGEWKTKYKQSKAEANAAQNTLQKEITTLRDANRTLQLKLRDIEVVNDDFERQARNTSSSLEDLESKYNVSIERGVILEEEIKVGEQEREGLRIETQRLRDELSDLKIESEIIQEKLRIAEATIERHHEQRTHALTTEVRPSSPLSEASTSATNLSSPITSTPPLSKSGSSTITETPPSPPLSETSANPRKAPATPIPMRRKHSIALDANMTPRAGHTGTIRGPRHSRGPSIPVSATGRTTPSLPRPRAPASRPSINKAQEGGLLRSGSLYQIRGLIGKMQKLEERVHSARSKLPAPTSTPPRASPRNGSALGHHIPNTVTVRSSRKRASGSTTTSSIHGGDSSVSRLSFGVPAPAPLDKGVGSSRPSSRASMASQNTFARPSSRSSMSGARTPLGHYSSASVSERRPRSSMNGALAASHGHTNSMSISAASGTSSNEDGDGFRTPYARRPSMVKDGTGIPTPSGIPRRQSGGVIGRRTSAGVIQESDMGPPQRGRKLSEVGETY